MGKRSCSFKVYAFIRDYGISVGQGVAAFFLAISAALLNDAPISFLTEDHTEKLTIQRIDFWVLLVVALINLLFFSFNLRGRKRQTELESRIEDLEELTEGLLQDVEALTSGYLLTLAKGPLGFRQGSDSERITMYTHDQGDNGGSFIPFGRFSYNPVFGRKNRDRYPADQGCIAKAWLHGSHFDNDFPDPIADMSGYKDKCKREYNILPRVVTQLTMKSRLYYACRIMDSGNAKPLAVVVIEATDPKRYTQEELKVIFEDNEREYMTRLVEVLGPRLPKISETREKGF